MRSVVDRNVVIRRTPVTRAPVQVQYSRKTCLRVLGLWWIGWAVQHYRALAMVCDWQHLFFFFTLSIVAPFKNNFERWAKSQTRRLRQWWRVVFYTPFWDKDRIFNYFAKTLAIFIRLNLTGMHGAPVAQLVEALRYKSEGRGFDSRWRHFSLT